MAMIEIMDTDEIIKKLKFMSCRQVAASMGGVTGAYLTYVRNGKTKPSMSMRKRLTDFFNENGYGDGNDTDK